MTNENLSKLKAEHTQKAIDHYVDVLIKTMDYVLFSKRQLEILKSKTKPTEDEKKRVEEHKANIDAKTEGIKDAEAHIEILQGMMEAFSNNKKIDL